jgi:hypothetical protein
MRVTAGTRVGFWNPDPGWGKSPFTCKGYYEGPDLGDLIPGTVLQQPLMEGVLEFQVGVLFRPDLGKRQRLETILILKNWIPEMFEYEDWSEDPCAGVGS